MIRTIMFSIHNTFSIEAYESTGKFFKFSLIIAK